MTIAQLNALVEVANPKRKPKAQKGTVSDLLAFQRAQG